MRTWLQDEAVVKAEAMRDGFSSGEFRRWKSQMAALLRNMGFRGPEHVRAVAERYRREGGAR